MTLASAERRCFRFGLIGPEDVANVRLAEGREGIVIELRSGDRIERSADLLEPYTPPH